MASLGQRFHRWRFAVLGGWIVTLVGLAVLAVGMGTAFTDSTNLPDSNSATAYRLLAESGAAGAATSADVKQGAIAWHTAGVAVDDPGVRAKFSAMLREIDTMPGVTSVVSPYQQAGATQVNKAASTAYASLALGSDADVAAITEKAEQLRASGVDVEVGGAAFEGQIGASHGTEGIGILAALIILFLVFRSGWAAALPIVTGVTGVVVSLLAVMLASHAVNLAADSITMGSLIGLGVGIDYALFIVNRYRKAVLGGASVPDAIGQALNTSGRAVIFAGLTVIIALLGMFVVGLGVLTGMAEAAALTVLFTVVAALTLLPALLAILGHRVLPRRQRAALAAGTGIEPAPAHRRGAAARWAALVQRIPLPAAGLALLAVVALALPVATMRVGDADASSDPASSATHSYYELMAAGFGNGFDAQLLLVAETPDAASAQAFTTLVSRLDSVGNVAKVSAAPVKAGQRIAIATVTPATSAQTEQTTDLVKTLRDQVIPAASAGTGLKVYVGGTTATSIDLADALMSKLPLYLGLIALLGFLLLAVAFRSVVVPLVGAVSNLATIVVGLGAVTAIFQHGWGSQLLGVGTGAPVMYLVPVMVIGIMFGLSMDYQVFLVSRMHEEWSHTRDNRRAVRVGVGETARVIAAAALIMLSVFASFGFSGERIVSMIGIGLASAVVVDAFIVRLTLIPAVMTLLGRANWYYPRWAERITPRVSVEGPGNAAPAPSANHEAPVLEPAEG